ncbi:class I SAM-dependent methyltransferase [Microvirga sp. 2MCAF38]|uniref:class I SAM-dependent methyltransferase n=1 Tax=Microvirga sp. 2MCAF38 TaxID=3232989 RepID=UPI003F9582DA
MGCIAGPHAAISTLRVNGFEARLSELIALEGPITVERYMSLCLQHYYATRDPLGARGDFTTAPEISQIFGELLGLWAAEMWMIMGRPSPCHLLELGPGRGTLMADALRAAKVLPEFRSALHVHLIETSPVLRESQRTALAESGVPLSWHNRIEDVPSGPAIVFANEFFDALPVRQYVSTERGWCERLVGLRADGHLAFGLNAEPEKTLSQSPQRLGEILEIPTASIAVAGTLAHRLASDGGAALLIDYGYWGPAFGDTLQAVHRHKFVDPLQEPGEADLTTHVDFHWLAKAGIDSKAHFHGPVTQAAFLEGLGIETRARSLKQRASPSQAHDIDLAVQRLTERGEKGMGELFKVLALSHPDLEAVPGLPMGRFQNAEL